MLRQKKKKIQIENNLYYIYLIGIVKLCIIFRVSCTLWYIIYLTNTYTYVCMYGMHVYMST